MNKKVLAVTCLVAVIIVGSFAVAQQPKADAAPPDPRIDKLLEQNEQILKNQAEILKQIGEANVQLGALRRRSS